MTTSKPLSETHPTLWKESFFFRECMSRDHDKELQSTTIDIAEHERAMRDLANKVNRGSLNYARGHEEGLKHGEEATLRRVKEYIENSPYADDDVLVALWIALGLGEEEKP